MWKKAVFGSALAGLLGYVLWACYLGPARHRIEWDVAIRVISTLQRTGFAEVTPVIDGRDVELRGWVPSWSEAERAERIVRRIPGVRVVRTEVMVGDADGGGDT